MADDSLFEAYEDMHAAFSRYKDAKDVKKRMSLYDRNKHEDIYLELKDRMYVAMEEMENIWRKIEICRRAQKLSLPSSNSVCENK